MTISISRELSLFNFKRLDILLASIGHPSEILWPFEFALRFHVKFRVSKYIMRLNRISERKFMSILISQELRLFNFKHIDIL